MLDLHCRSQTQGDEATKENIDDILKHHHEAQEKIANEMIRMAQSMKHTSIVASNIIKTDKEVTVVYSSLFSISRFILELQHMLAK